jgi:hypothetical protein
MEWLPRCYTKPFFLGETPDELTTMTVNGQFNILHKSHSGKANWWLIWNDKIYTWYCTLKPLSMQCSCLLRFALSPQLRLTKAQSHYSSVSLLPSIFPIDAGRHRLTEKSGHVDNTPLESTLYLYKTYWTIGRAVSEITTVVTYLFEGQTRPLMSELTAFS